MFYNKELNPIIMNTINKKWEEAIKAHPDNSFTCPNCGRFCGNAYDKPTSFVDKEPTKFIDAPDPHYSWKELHECINCGTFYTVQNGT